VGELVRFVIGPDGGVVPDVKQKLPGRGLWIEASRKRVAEGIRRKVFARGFRQEVRVPPDLADLIETMLAEAVTDALVIAAKAGEVEPGFVRTETALAEGRAVALIHAANAAPDGVRKLKDAAKRAGLADLPAIDRLAGEKLDLVLGRSNVIHAALLAGPAGATLLKRWERLVRFRDPDGERLLPTPDISRAVQD
jgi:predicted RNA-binding protein YlxR (DUF448 family)